MFRGRLWAALALLLLATSATEGVPSHKAPDQKHQRHNQDGSTASGLLGVIEMPFVMTADFFYANREVINAFSTAVIGAFTILLFFATYGQLRHLRREFHASHRPKLVIRALDLFWVRDETTISFDLINEGEADAYHITAAFSIKERIGDFDVGTGGRPIVFEDGQIPDRLSIGQSARCVGKCSINMPNLFGGWQDAKGAGTPFEIGLIFDGAASYSGSTGIFRRSGYNRRYDPDNLRFRPADNPDREYPG
jgi:hypothetical protein